MSSKTKPSANRAAAALRLAANALHRSDSALGAFLRRKKAQLGAPKAITATAHKLARLIYSMLRYGQEYVDTVVSEEQSYARIRPVQRRLTGDHAQNVCSWRGVLSGPRPRGHWCVLPVE